MKIRRISSSEKEDNELMTDYQYMLIEYTRVVWITMVIEEGSIRAWPR
jgi:hypothetical protein